METRWIEEAQQGDGEAFGRLTAYFRGMAFAVAYDRLRDVHLAEDAVQEAFIEAYTHIGRLEQPAAFPGWFKTIVIRQCQRTLRRKRHSGLPLEEALQLSEETQSVAELAEQKEGARILHQSVAELSDRLRVPLQLFYFYGYSLQEISAYLDIPLSALKKRLFDARRKLRGALPVIDLASVFNSLYEGGRNMLHIVNGDSVGNMLKQGIVQGDVLVWREVYSAGPNVMNSAGDQERAFRAKVLEQSMGIPSAEYIAGCKEQEKRLQDYSSYEEVVLWFEHDLFDQSMLAYLLHWFKGRRLGRTRLSLLCIGEFPGIGLFHGLGQLTPEQLSTLNGTWRSIGPDELELGSELWQAYAAADPEQMADLLELRKDQLAASALPFAYTAFQAHLSRLPSVENGLGIVEQTTLLKVRGGADTPLKLFRQVTDELHVLGMGDLEYWLYLRGMVQGPNPLLYIDGAEAADHWDFRQVTDFLNRKVTATTLGGQVLDGKKDRVTAQGIDVWYGGLHLQGHSVPWRWDSLAQRPVRM
ncbi:DNA-directed RNA polymerase subunit sigma [Paenibacillus sp. FSL R7-0273]|uniref:sigma-70 family RNA polymerase sigma factor n=1 Tax=Paenibacillus sp. FSL R7-0273 TaxID=1536772 RepID=UPI0004F90CFA|nr:sigma-70 family RNA polymerase sigma factor [Paenibacillus sp. FSL R7-0273]AIQ48260.1 DNA-directed RNA polymerase subunit sigma [Paenibacillus sp. FSL R7-0273]OMF92026.1 RNA polymerase subunit sigma [Paenibacillus sp. FSL R7-0273]